MKGQKEHKQVIFPIFNWKFPEEFFPYNQEKVY